MFTAIMIFILFSIVAGLAFCFYGERRFTALSTAAAFVYGSLIAFMFIRSSYSLMTALIVSGLIGLAVCAAAYFLGSVFRFIIGIFAGMMIAFVILFFLPVPSQFNIPIIAAFGALFGVLSLLYKKACTAVSTSVFGSFLFSSNFALLVYNYVLLYTSLSGVSSNVLMNYWNTLNSACRSSVWLFTGMLAAFFIAGLVVQFINLPKKAKAQLKLSRKK